MSVVVGYNCPRGRVTSSLMCELPMELRQHVRNAMSVVLAGASLVFHVCYEGFLAFGFDGSGVVESTEVAQDICNVFVVLTHRFLDDVAGVLFCLSVIVGC